VDPSLWTRTVVLETLLNDCNTWPELMHDCLIQVIPGVNCVRETTLAICIPPDTARFAWVVPSTFPFEILSGGSHDKRLLVFIAAIY